MTKIKICGLKRKEDILYSNELLPDYIGLVFAKSKRQVSENQAKSLVDILDNKIKAVGVFVNEDIDVVINIAKNIGLFAVQLHGNEDNDYINSLKISLKNIEIWKAVRVKDEKDVIKNINLKSDKLLFDAYSKNAYGGIGEKFDWEILKKVKDKIKKQFFIAGGINENNVLDAINILKPYGIDVSSNVETDGFKSFNKMKDLINKVRGNSNAK